MLFSNTRGASQGGSPKLHITSTPSYHKNVIKGIQLENLRAIPPSTSATVLCWQQQCNEHVTGERVGSFSKQGASLWQSVCMELGQEHIGWLVVTSQEQSTFRQLARASAEDWTMFITMRNA